MGTAPLPINRGRNRLAHLALIAIANYANGLSWRLDIRSWQFVLPELTDHILHLPIDEWICLDAVTDLQSGGVA